MKTSKFFAMFFLVNLLTLGISIPIFATSYLYVSGHNSNNILRYSASTGDFVDEFIDNSDGRISEMTCFSFGPDGNLCVADHTDNHIVRYDGQTGAFIDNFISSGYGGLSRPLDMLFGPNNYMYVVNKDTNNVLRNSQTGAFIDVSLSFWTPPLLLYYPTILCVH